MLRVAVWVSVGLMVAACGDDDAGSGGSGGSGATSAATGTTSAGAGGSSTSASGGADGASGGGGPNCEITPTPGTTTETVMVGGAERTYVLVVPEAVDGTAFVPLILGHHGFGGTAEAASNYFDLTGTEAAIYVYPQAEALPMGGVGWDMAPDGVDLAFFDALIAELTAAFCVDESRIFAAGHSHGGSFSNHLGCFRPDLVRAVAPVAGGGPWAGSCPDGTSVSAMVTHGSNDMDVSIDSGIGSRDHWLEANGCSGATSTAVDPSPCVQYDGCSEPVRWCEHDGGHEWPPFAGAGIRDYFLSF